MTARLLFPFSTGFAVTLALFLLMAWMVRPPHGAGEFAPANIEDVKMVEPSPQQKPEQEAPPPPQTAALPSAPALATPQLPEMSAMTALPLDASVSVPVNLSGSGCGLGRGALSGFGQGAGSGGGGYGQGQGFAGKELIPLSTARPQIPEWAYKRGIEGWVECVFTVMPNGRVRDVKIVDAQPKGVFEAAAIESISNWIYPEYPKARQVKQRVEFKLSDFQYNWQ